MKSEMEVHLTKFLSFLQYQWKSILLLECRLFLFEANMYALNPKLLKKQTN